MNVGFGLEELIDSFAVESAFKIGKEEHSKSAME
jgi:hypothetical protein